MDDDAPKDTKNRTKKILAIVGGSIVAAGVVTLGVLFSVPATRKKMLGKKKDEEEEEEEEVEAEDFFEEEEPEKQGFFARLLSFGSGLYP